MAKLIELNDSKLNQISTTWFKKFEFDKLDHSFNTFKSTIKSIIDGFEVDEYSNGFDLYYHNRLIEFKILEDGSIQSSVKNSKNDEISESLIIGNHFEEKGNVFVNFNLYLRKNVNSTFDIISYIMNNSIYSINKKIFTMFDSSHIITSNKEYINIKIFTKILQEHMYFAILPIFKRFISKLDQDILHKLRAIQTTKIADYNSVIKNPSLIYAIEALPTAYSLHTQLINNNIDVSKSKLKNIAKNIYSASWSDIKYVFGNFPQMNNMSLSKIGIHDNIIMSISMLPNEYRPNTRKDWKVFVNMNKYFSTSVFVELLKASSYKVLLKGLDVPNNKWHNVITQLEKEFNNNITTLMENLFRDTLENGKFIDYIKSYNLRTILRISEIYHDYMNKAINEYVLKNEWYSYDFEPLDISKKFEHSNILVSSYQLANEGKKMDHCVGSYYDRVLSDSLIFSISNPNDSDLNSTVEFKFNGDSLYLNQHYAYDNSIPNNWNKQYTNRMLKYLNNHIDLVIKHFENANEIKRIVAESDRNYNNQIEKMKHDFFSNLKDIL